jgi:hypothetical protein
MCADRPEKSKAGEVSINVPESVIDSLDAVFDSFGLPEPGSVAYRLSPDYWADAFDFPTPDDLADDFMGKMDNNLGVDHPPER